MQHKEAPWWCECKITTCHRELLACTLCNCEYISTKQIAIMLTDIYQIDWKAIGKEFANIFLQKNKTSRTMINVMEYTSRVFTFENDNFPYSAWRCIQSLNTAILNALTRIIGDHNVILCTSVEIGVALATFATLTRNIFARGVPYRFWHELLLYSPLCIIPLPYFQPESVTIYDNVDGRAIASLTRYCESQLAPLRIFPNLSSSPLNWYLYDDINIVTLIKTWALEFNIVAFLKTIFPHVLVPLIKQYCTDKNLF